MCKFAFACVCVCVSLFIIVIGDFKQWDMHNWAYANNFILFSNLYVCYLCQKFCDYAVCVFSYNIQW